MSHLDLEILARIADEGPTAEEAAHLDACAECADELDALQEQAAALAALPAPPVPDSVWRGVEARLAAEPPVTPIASRRRRPRAAAWLLQAAAAAAVFVAGTAVGARIEPSPDPVDRSTPADQATAVYPPVERDAEASLREAEAFYAAALSRYMAERGTSDEVDPMRRLAALESIILTTRAALDETPQDPVITGYYRAALAQREALLTQVQYVEGEWF